MLRSDPRDPAAGSPATTVDVSVVGTCTDTPRRGGRQCQCPRGGRGDRHIASAWPTTTYTLTWSAAVRGASPDDARPADVYRPCGPRPSSVPTPRPRHDRLRNHTTPQRPSPSIVKDNNDHHLRAGLVVRRDVLGASRQHRAGHPRQAPRDRARSRDGPHRRPRAARGRARHWQDGARQDTRTDGRRDALAHPVHPRPAAERRDGVIGVGSEGRGVRVARGSHLRQRRPGRRDQPRKPQDAVGAPRGDGGGKRDIGRDHAPRRHALHRARHPEPDRASGNLPASRGPTRPLHDQDLNRLPRRGGDHAHPAGNRVGAGRGRRGGRPRRRC